MDNREEEEVNIITFIEYIKLYFTSLTITSCIYIYERETPCLYQTVFYPQLAEMHSMLTAILSPLTGGSHFFLLAHPMKCFIWQRILWSFAARITGLSETERVIFKKNLQKLNVLTSLQGKNNNLRNGRKMIFFSIFIINWLKTFHKKRQSWSWDLDYLGYLAIAYMTTKLNKRFL